MRSCRGSEQCDVTFGRAATIVSINSVVGAVSSALSGIISDRFFKSRRRGLALSAGVLNVVALVLFMLVPGRHPWLDVAAMVMFGFAVGILLTFLGGLMAVDYVPKCAAGAALGIAGMGDYLAVFWIAMAVLSVVCGVWAGKRSGGWD